jgi:phage gpG-like protein
MSPEVRITSNIAQKLRSMERYNRLLNNKIMLAAWHRILDLVGQTSAADFWITTSASVGSNITQPTNPSKLTMRSGRLLGSLVGARRFTAVRLPSSVDRFAAKQFSSSGAGFSRGKKEAIRRVKVSAGQVSAEIGSEVPYAAIHEFGGMAGRGKTVNIPARPYLQPAAEKATSEGQVENILRESVEATFRDANI